MFSHVFLGDVEPFFKFDLRDPVWGGAAFCLAVFLALVAMFAWLYKRRRFACTSIEYSLIRGAPQVAEMKIIVKDKEIHDAAFWTVSFCNVGGSVIRPEDWEQPLTVVFPANALVIWADAKPQKSIPIKLEAAIKENPSRIEVSTGVLNVGDSFNVQALVAGQNQKVTIEGRAAGIKRIEGIHRVKTFLLVLKLLARPFMPLICLLALVSMIGTMGPGYDKMSEMEKQIDGFIAAMGFCVSVTWSILEFSSLISFLKALR
jgi:hypothetical protein